MKGSRDKLSHIQHDQEKFRGLKINPEPNSPPKTYVVCQFINRKVSHLTKHNITVADSQKYVDLQLSDAVLSTN